MRLPGFLHQKKEPVLPQITHTRDGVCEVASLVQLFGLELQPGNGRSQPGDGESPLLANLRRLGLLGKQLKEGQWALTCPWAAEHTTNGTQSTTVFWEPHYGGYSGPAFNCFHQHCAKRDIGSLLTYLAQSGQQRSADWSAAETRVNATGSKVSKVSNTVILILKMLRLCSENYHRQHRSH
jgi:hypothetical protein